MRNINNMWLRRLRKNKNIRDLVAETVLSPQDFIMPYFVIEGKNKKEEIESMPGVYHLSIDNLLREIKKDVDLGIPAILLFGVINDQRLKTKDQRRKEVDSRVYSKEGIIQKAVKAIKKEFPPLVVITDLCLCGYTSHGHCGVVRAKSKGFFIDNEATLKTYQRIALAQAEAGADFVAPSGMMDGQVRAIRESLDKGGFNEVGILSYSAKYASNFYGPFREALNSSPQFGDRKSYQMDFRTLHQALREVEQDINEGADIVMVKPALCYLDVIRAVKDNFSVPLAAYNVSGEYAMVKRFCQDRQTERSLMVEILTAIKRAGADIIISYYAKEVIRNKLI